MDGFLQSSDALDFLHEHEHEYDSQKYRITCICYDDLYMEITEGGYADEIEEEYGENWSDDYELVKKLYSEQYGWFCSDLVNNFNFIKFESTKNMFTISSIGAVTLDEFLENWCEDFMGGDDSYIFDDIVKGSKDYHDGINIHSMKFEPVEE